VYRLATQTKASAGIISPVLSIGQKMSAIYKDELKTGTLHAMLDQLGLCLEDL